MSESTTAEPSVSEWKDLNWRSLQLTVWKIQMRIFKASQRGDKRAVHRLERLLMRSWSAKCLAVRRVTQDNRGKKTAGVDGVANLTPPQRLKLAVDLSVHQKPQPVRRVWIPKPGKAERRPLGIPTMRNRAAQTLVRLALEPEWEAHFEPNSYGFRPGRSVHDALVAVYLAIKHKSKYCLDADIAGCFDNIDHAALLRKLGTFSRLRRTIRRWLTAGVWDGVDFNPTKSGTPQGGALSPLLANVALHGLEQHIRSAFPGTRVRNRQRFQNWKPFVVRYADDFVVLHEDRQVIEQVREIATQWLRTVGLELKPEKTRICHTLMASNGVGAGFDFLGHTVRQYPVGKYRTGCNTYGEPLGFKSRITPSKNAQARHHDELTRIIRQKRGAPQEALINELNPVIKGWANFYSRAVSSQVFSKMDWLLFRPLWRWASRRHPTKSSGWIKRRYWLDQERRHWVFKDRKTRAQLALHASTPIERHTKVRGNASPYDGNLLYWAWRLQEHPELPRRTSFLMRRQKGQCAWCGLFFTSMDEVTEVDHVQPRSNGGTSMSRNLQLLHGHCHDAKTAQDGSTGPRPKERTVSMTMTIHRGAVCQETGKHGSEGERDAERHIA